MPPETDAAKYAAAHNNTTLLANGKLRFDQTGMEFPSTVTSSVLAAYANGKAFRRTLARRANEAYDFSIHQPYIVPHKHRDERHFLYCTLTKATLPRDPQIVQKHVSAKKFRRKLTEVEQAKKKQLELAEKRRQKRERANAARKSEGEQDMGDDDDESQEEDDDRMEEDNDIVYDDDDTDNTDDTEKQSPGSKGFVKQHGEKLGEAEQDADVMEEFVAEEKDIFWTRGRRGTVPTGNDDADGRGDSATKRKSRLRSSKKKTLNESADNVVESGNGSPSDPEQQDTATGKRNRTVAQVPKKVRRARQRRKSARQT